MDSGDDLEEGEMDGSSEMDARQQMISPISAHHSSLSSQLCLFQQANGPIPRTSRTDNSLPLKERLSTNTEVEILQASEFDLDLPAVTHLWNQGSVVRSWLLELLERAYEDDPQMASITGYVEDSGEGRWTVMESINESVPAPVIALSLMMRFRSRQDDTYSGKILSALRNQFGGHAVQKAGGS